MSNTNTFVGSKIKGLRETKNLSIEEVAESTGLSVEQINSIENDQNLPSLGPLIKIARALGVRLGTFMDDNDVTTPSVSQMVPPMLASTWSIIPWHSRKLVVTWNRLSSISILRPHLSTSCQLTRVRSSST